MLHSTLQLLFTLFILLLTYSRLTIVVKASKSSESSKSSLASHLNLPQPHLVFCALCETIVNEIEHNIATTKQQYNVQSRFRVDEKQHIPYARTEYRLLEIIENEVRPKLALYGLSNHTDRPRLVKHPNANTEGTYPSTHYTQSISMTESFQLIYDKLIEMHLDELLEAFYGKPKANSVIKQQVCVALVKACKVDVDFDAEFEALELIPPATTSSTSSSSTSLSSNTTSDSNTQDTTQTGVTFDKKVTSALNGETDTQTAEAAVEEEEVNDSETQNAVVNDAVLEQTVEHGDL